MLSSKQALFLAWYTSLARFVPADFLPPAPARTLEEKAEDAEKLASLLGIDLTELVHQ